MKKLLVSLLLSITVISVLSTIPLSVQAAEGDEETPVEVNATKEMLDRLDPLRQEGDVSEYADQFSTPGGIITRVMSFAFPLAGMVLFVMIVVGGLQMILGGGEQKAVDEGRQRVTMAIIGFILLFSSYWVAQILETLFNIKIL